MSPEIVLDVTPGAAAVPLSVLKIRDDAATEAPDHLAVEEPLEIRLGGPAITYLPEGDPNAGRPWMEAFLRFVSADVAIADGRYDSVGRADGTDQRMLTSMVLRREGGAWKIDDMFAESFPSGLRQALRETIAEDKALRGERG